ncbi:MAG: tetratricopeptide repeat protein [Gallionellaceae bacterium]
MSTTDQKTLCPCGSGKEYKKCCMGKYAAINKASQWGRFRPYRAGLYEVDIRIGASAVSPGRALHHFDLGNELHSQGRLDEAIGSYQKAALIKPDFFGAYINLGLAYQAQGKLNASVENYRKAVALNPNNADACFNLANALKKQGKLAEAINFFRKALALNPKDVEAFYNMGNALQDIGELDEAVKSYHGAIVLNPGYSDAYNNLGNTLQKQGKLGEAISNYREALKRNADNVEAYNSLVNALLHSCDWAQYDVCVKETSKAVEEGKLVLPFLFTAISQSPSAQLKCAQNYTALKHPITACPLWTGQKYSHDKIRVAYLSADFHNHATAYLMAGLFELHDKERFEISAISFGPEDAGSEMRKRLRRAFDRFEDVRGMGDYETALMLRDLEIDIAVDLKGHTKDSRTGILAYRAAPVQVNALGFPGTMGAAYMDYIIADRHLIPPEHLAYYTEKVVYMPDSYQVNDDRRQIAERTPTRTEAGLPESGFIFCCFNNNFKIAPEIFTVWMRLLGKVEGSVLWLLEDNPSASVNLKREAAQRGVAPERLVFAKRMDLADHLARHRLADLFLDTLPYNAHTTSSDALWAGLPVLTCKGSAFAGRVAASLLNAVGLPELATDNLEDYESLALEFAANPAVLAEIRNRLALNRTSYPLFDTDRYRRHIESAYITMWERHQRGEPPTSFAVGA